ncbi:short-chain dehydrogenase [Mycena latifolia]|nr:short-chain dehydrogenase [Mycena latifolia]
MSHSIFSSSSTADEVATAFASEIKGRNVLITGTSLNGIGFETARVIAKYANLVIITGYNSERLKLSEDTIKKDEPSANIRPLLLDLSSLAGVRKAAAEVNAYTEPLHVLIHNAAAAAGPFKLTADNLESQIATGHIGPFLLTKLLAPKLLAARTATYVPRVLFVSSIAQASGTGVNFSTIACPNAEKYQTFDTYFQTKAANVLTAIELSKRSKGTIKAYSLHPGLIYTNIYQKEESIADMQAAGLIGPDGKPNPQMPWKTIPQGAATTVAAAFDPRLDNTPGAYLSDCVEANKELAEHSSDPVIAQKLWEVTEDIVGEKFVF